ncbi:glucans biosynthesis glucosyltransferase MdoH [Roseibium algae]|uniref:Glucans biosynthesis glucosyltransferase H n=1 Tax=Roseibium algae TaxID=3123038 RepID=A0ABU8TQS8_9HYPH
MRNIPEPSYQTPTARRMTGRRTVFAMLVLVSFFALATLMAMTLAPGGFGFFKATMFLCFLLTLPWTIIGFWNAVIGLLTMRLVKNPAAFVCPIDTGDDTKRLTSKTALLSCVRDEDPTDLESRLNAMLAGLVRTGEATAFSLYILSDTSREEIAFDEQKLVERLSRQWSTDICVTYRRRTDNSGFKAGNIEDFCDRWGVKHDFALVLDADSYMSADAILGLVRRMEANPKLGILQSLVVGLPTDSAFARIFQFGMRLGMRSYTMGSAWWQGDCGPYWGHNALLRIKPFMEQCRLPTLPGSGPLSGSILSHDQVEATLMRRAGYEVRVLPQEGGSYEENPPHLLEFIRRDLRWCQGNLQYASLLGLPKLKLVSRIQLLLAMLMFIGSPAWIGFMISAALAGLSSGDTPLFHPTTGYSLFFIIMGMVFAPKLATVLDIISRPDLRNAFGGPFRILLGTLIEIAYAAMLAPVMAMAHTLFIGGLIFGKTIGWGAQGRHVEQLPLGLATSRLWPQTLFGLLGIAWISTQSLADIWPVIPIAAGPLLAIPFAIGSSSPRLGLLAIKSSLWRTPEEANPPAELVPLALKALREEANVIQVDSESLHIPPQREPVRAEA